ncbi:MAG: AAA family ATPase [SAR202 cluster bacterium]|nr:AAA family ATPase [SAR202 cluster bacterium]
MPDILSRIRVALRCGNLDCPCQDPYEVKHCPAHPGPAGRPNLAIESIADGAGAWFRCAQGCTQLNVVDVLRERGLWPQPPGRAAAAALQPTLQGSTSKTPRPAPTPVPDSRAEAPAARPRFQTKLFAELLSEPKKERRWLWDGMLLAGGLSLIAGKPKVGKSNFTRNLALATSLGESFLDRATVQGPVLYLGMEEDRDEVEVHLVALGGDGSELIHIYTGMAPEQAVEALRTNIMESRAVLAITDSLQDMVRMGDVNDYAIVKQALASLRDMARQTGCHILAVYHLGKGEREGGDAILGSAAILGAVDAALLLRRREGHGILESIQRYGKDLPRTVLLFDAAIGRFTLGGTLEQVQQQATGAKVLEALKGGVVTQAQIREAMEGDGRLVNQALRSLMAGQKIQREGSGRKGNPFLYSLSIQVPSYYDQRGSGVGKMLYCFIHQVLNRPIEHFFLTLKRLYEAMNARLGTMRASQRRLECSKCSIQATSNRRPEPWLRMTESEIRCADSVISRRRPTTRTGMPHWTGGTRANRTQRMDSGSSSA